MCLCAALRAPAAPEPTPAAFAAAPAKTAIELAADAIDRAVAASRLVTDEPDYPHPERRRAAADALNRALAMPMAAAGVAWLRDHPREALLNNLMVIVHRAEEDSSRGRKQQRLLESIGFSRLRTALGGGQTPGGAASLLSRLQDYDQQIIAKLRTARALNRVDRETLIRQQRELERGMFLVNLIGTGIAFGAFGHFAGPLLGMHPLRLLGLLGGSWATSSVFTFGLGWPYLRNWATRRLRGYKDTRASFAQALSTHGQRAVPLVERFAETPGTAMTPLQDAAFSALMAAADPDVTHALVDLGAHDLRVENYKRARQIFTEISRRDDAGLGQFAGSVIQVLDARDAYNRAKFWFQARYAVKNAGMTGALLAAGIGGSYLFFPHATTFYMALASGMGLAGAREILGRLWLRYPADKLRDHLAGKYSAYLKALQDAIVRARPLDSNVRRELQILRDRLELTDKERSDSESVDERVDAAICALDLREIGLGMAR